MSDPKDIQRLIGDVVRFGVIASVDLAQATCRVAIGDITTTDLPWLTRRAGKTRTWSAPSVGEQCILLCAEGDTEAGIVLPGVFSDAMPAPSSAAVELIQFEDGAVISYDPAAHQLTATLPDGGKAALTATGGVSITGDVTITGKINVSGNATFGADASISGKATAGTDVVGGGISLKNHKHPGVQSGGSLTQAPV